jgi:hypothetical protein
MLLVSLTGVLVVTMAANLLTLALGSALIDLALVGAILWAAGKRDGERGMSLVVAVPGVASTLLLLLAALRLDAEVGHNSLLAQNLPADILGLVGIAGVLRLLIYPLHPWEQRSFQDAAGSNVPVGAGESVPVGAGSNVPVGAGESVPVGAGNDVAMAAGLLLPVGAGIYTIARVQAIEPVLSSKPWLIALGAIAFLAGGLLVWGGSLMAAPRERPEGVGFWPGVLIVQVASALLYRLLLSGAALWPLVCLPLVLGTLIVWWDAAQEEEEGTPVRWMEWVVMQAGRGRAWLATRVPAVERLRNWRLRRLGMVWLPAIALASLVGIPFTAGAALRWAVYASLLRQGHVSLLALLAGDTFLVAGLLITLRSVTLRARGRRFRLASSLGLVALALPILILGIAPGWLGLRTPRAPDVSVWGLGLLYLLPWLLGGWLALLSSRLEGYARLVYAVVDLGWLYDLLAWAGKRLEGLVFWLGRVGEGDGWWGWALIILALGAIFLLVG